MDSLGLSFMPGGQQDASGSPNGQRPTPVQSAIQTLSLRIPKTVGAASGAPEALLTSPGGSALGNPNSAALLEQLRRWLFGGGANPGREALQLPTPQATTGARWMLRCRSNCRRTSCMTSRLAPHRLLRRLRLRLRLRRSRGRRWVAAGCSNVARVRGRSSRCRSTFSRCPTRTGAGSVSIRSLVLPQRAPNQP